MICFLCASIFNMKLEPKLRKGGLKVLMWPLKFNFLTAS